MVTFESPIHQAIYDYIAKRPGSVMSAIMSHAYRHVRNPYPTRTQTISGHIAKMNKTLSAYGLKITTRQGPGATYRIVKLKDPH